GASFEASSKGSLDIVYHAFVLTPLALLKKLVALIPPPGVHHVRFHGVFGPASRWRKQVIPLLSESSATAGPCVSAPRRAENVALAGPDLVTTTGRQRPAEALPVRVRVEPLADAYRDVDPRHSGGTCGRILRPGWRFSWCARQPWSRNS